MALSRIALLLFAQVATSAYLEFPLLDSNDRPTGFKEGLPTYVNATIDYGQGEDKKPLELFLLCTTCTISYIFGNPDDFSLFECSGTEDMVFKEGGKNVTVEFCNTSLTLTSVNSTDNSETPYSVDFSIGYISPEFQSLEYFDNFKENMIGLAPMLTEDQKLKDRQFLYKFINAKE